MLFQQPPSGEYEYCNPCKYARSETAVDSDAKLGGCGDNSDSDDTYEKISLSMAKEPESPTTPALDNKQLAQNTGGLIYEPLPDLCVKAEDETTERKQDNGKSSTCLLYTSPSPRDS